MIELASERVWRSALIPFRKISKDLSTYIQNMLPMKRGIITTASRLDRSSEESWPDGFHSPIKNEIETTKSSKKSIMAGELKIFNTEIIYS